jgi:hypothetical protein
MKSEDPSPPSWAEALLRTLLRPSDRESISGDLLEEYRAARYPALGAFHANAWYIKHVLSVLWHLIRPCALALTGLTLASLMVKALWYGSLVPAPGLSLLNALIYLWAGYIASRRTRLVKTGMLAAGATSFVGLFVFFTAAAIRAPGLVLAPLANPFIFVILSILMLQGLAYGVLMGAVGGVISTRFGPVAPRKVRAS